jgi:hypothetical protein
VNITTALNGLIAKRLRELAIEPSGLLTFLAPAAAAALFKAKRVKGVTQNIEKHASKNGATDRHESSDKRG